MAVRVQLRNDTAANWASVNPVLALGEPGIERVTGLIKIGDGVSAWTALAYVNTPATAGLPTVVAFATAVSLNGVKEMGQHSVTGPETYTIGASPANGGQNHVTIIPNGVDTPNISAFTLLSGSDTYSQTNVMELYFEYRNGRAYAGWLQGAAIVAAPLAPSIPVAGTITTTTLAVSTTAGGGGTATDFVWEYKAAASPTWLLFSDGVSATPSTVITGLIANTSYNVRVSAQNSGGVSAASPTLTVSTASAAVSRTDNFNRADGPANVPSDGGSAWATIHTNNNVLTIIGNTCRNSGGYQVSSGTLLNASANATITLDVTGGSMGDGEVGIIFRGVDGSNYHRFVYDKSTGQLRLKSFVLASLTDMAAAVTFNPGTTPFSLTVICNGDSIICKRDAVEVFNVTNSALNTGVRHGIFIYASSQGQWITDNFVAAPF